MADGVGTDYSGSKIQSNYEKYKSYFSKKDTTNLDQNDFLYLMAEQMKNQDFNNPTDNTQFIAQMAQFSALQSQQVMTQYTQSSYASSLVGKNVLVASYDNKGKYVKETGAVTAVNISNGKFSVVINKKTYDLSNVIGVGEFTKEDLGTVTDDKTSEDKTDDEKVDGTGSTTDTKTDDKTVDNTESTRSQG